MPARLGRLHPRFGTPWGAVVLSSACYSVCAFWSFKELIVLNVWLYSITLVLELAAFVALRLRERGCRGRGAWAAAGRDVAGGGLPSLCCLLAMATAGGSIPRSASPRRWTGPVAYLIWRAPAPRAMS